jgi:hypothetical protein
MHPTPTAPSTGPVVPTTEQVADARTYLLAHGLHGCRRDAFVKGYLSSVVKDLATGQGGITGTVSRALAMVTAVDQLDTEADGFTTTGRDNPETGQSLPTGVTGYPCGRYAR